MNYGNRNASSALTNRDLALSYSCEVAVACSTALFSRMYLAKSLAKMSGPKLIMASAALNFSAAALSGAANLVMMRQKELKTGISVQDQSGETTYG